MKKTQDTVVITDKKDTIKLKYSNIVINPITVEGIYVDEFKHELLRLKQIKKSLNMCLSHIGKLCNVEPNNELNIENLIISHSSFDVTFSIDLLEVMSSFSFYKGVNLRPKHFTYYYIHKALQSFKTKIENEINNYNDYIKDHFLEVKNDEMIYIHKLFNKTFFQN